MAHKSYLILGGTGFVGTRVAHAVSGAGGSVRILARRAPSAGVGEMVLAAISDIRSLRQACRGVQGIFHLAGNANEAGSDHAASLEDNRVLADIAVSEGVQKIVYFSSVKVYGSVSDGKEESSVLVPDSEYGKTKAAIEQVFLDKASAGLAVTVLRLPPVYGPVCKGNMGALVRMIDRGFVPPLPRASGPRSLVHVDDVVQAALLAYRSSGRGGAAIYNVTDGVSYSLADLYRAVREAGGKKSRGYAVSPGMLRKTGVLGSVAGALMGRRLPFDRRAIEQLLAPAWYSGQRIVTELGYQPRHRFSSSDGALEMLRHCRGLTPS